MDKPRIAIFYESRLHRNDGNPLYVWASLKRRQEKGELEIDHLAPTGDTDLFGKYNMLVWVDWGEDGLGGLLPYKPVFPDKSTDAPVVYWASDTHVGYKHRLDTARKADVVFVAQKDAVDRFAADWVPGAIWLPHAVEPAAYPHFNYAAKKYDVGFVGHVSSSNRIDMLDRAFREFPNFYYGQRLFEKAAERYCQTKVCLNISMKDDINMRCFEVLGCGSFLLTDRTSNIEEIFEDGKHLVLYDSLDDMVEKARYYIEHDEEREAIAKAGMEYVLANHTIDHRVDKMLKTVKDLVPA